MNKLLIAKLLTVFSISLMVIVLDTVIPTLGKLTGNIGMGFNVIENAIKWGFVIFVVLPYKNDLLKHKVKFFVAIFVGFFFLKLVSRALIGMTFLELPTLVVISVSIILLLSTKLVIKQGELVQTIIGKNSR